MNGHSSIREQQMQLDEVSEMLKKIKMKLRKNQVKGVRVPDQLLFLISNLNRQETEIWGNIRIMNDADHEARLVLEKDIQSKMHYFKESCAKAISLLPLD